MIKVRSYIKTGNGVFVDINDHRGTAEVIRKADPNYIDGAIYLECDNMVLLDFSHWDLVDQLWSYIINLIDAVLKYGKGKTYFPDQPLCLEFVSVSSDFLQVTLEGTQKLEYILPKYDLCIELLLGAERFFEALSNHGQNCYSYEFDKIKTLLASVRLVGDDPFVTFLPL